MKQLVIRAIGLALGLLFIFSAPAAFADEVTLNMESKVIADFDDMDAQSWFVIGSKFSTAGYPKIASVKAWPTALHGIMSDDKDFRSLGVAVLFDRKEYNWVDVIPGKRTGSDDEPNYEPEEIPLPGRVSMLDMWVWSGNFNYYIEVYLRDYTGIVHVLPLGNLDHVGWKNLRTNVPNSIPQSKKFVPKQEGLKLVKFRIWGRPTEVAAVPASADAPLHEKALYFYFDNFKILTDMFESIYDGDALMDSVFIEETWGSDSTK